jgi:hypothetical protein
VPLGACERACVDVAAGTGILGWIDVADGAERGEERIHGSGFVRAWQMQSTFKIDTRDAISKTCALSYCCCCCCCTRKMLFCRYQYLSAPYYHSLTAIIFSLAQPAEPTLARVAQPSLKNLPNLSTGKPRSQQHTPILCQVLHQVPAVPFRNPLIMPTIIFPLD